MNKFMERCTLIILVIILLYNLANVNVYEGLMDKLRKLRMLKEEKAAQAKIEALTKNKTLDQKEEIPISLMSDIHSKVDQLKNGSINTSNYLKNFNNNFNVTMDKIIQITENNINNNIALKSKLQEKNDILQNNVNQLSTSISENRISNENKYSSLGNNISKFKKQIRKFKKNNKIINSLLDEANKEIKTRYTNN